MTTPRKGCKAGKVSFGDDALSKAQAFSQDMIYKRVAVKTNQQNKSNWLRFVDFCIQCPEYADPREKHFSKLPEAIVCLFLN